MNSTDIVRKYTSLSNQLGGSITTEELLARGLTLLKVDPALKKVIDLRNKRQKALDAIESDLAAQIKKLKLEL